MSKCSSENALPPQHFGAFASSWANLRFPLRPNAETVQAFKTLANRHARVAPTITHVLGLTPEFVNTDWLETKHLYAIDHSVEMIDALWAGNTGRRTVVKADWTDNWPGVEPSGLTLGDGILTLYDYPNGVRSLSESIARNQSEDALLLIRGFCQRQNPPSLREILTAARNHQITNFHEFKLLLLNATQGTNTYKGVKLADVWDSFFHAFESVERCLDQTGWPAEEVLTIHLYKDNQKIYHMATVQEIAQAMESQYSLIEQTQIECSSFFSTPVMAFRKVAV